VIYRLPLDKSIVWPPSSCPSCGMRIAFYDNIPLFSWLVLRGRCRGCRAPISPRYLLIELTTALLFIGIYLWFFMWEFRRTGLEGADSMDRFFFSGGWLIYLNVMVLTGAFLAASAIDLELWLIPLSLCWLVTIVGMLTSCLWPWFLHFTEEGAAVLFPVVSPRWAAVSAGSAIGLLVALLGLKKGWIEGSYVAEEEPSQEAEKNGGKENPDKKEPEFEDRKEIVKEIFFLLPVIMGALAGYFLMKNPALFDRWSHFSQLPLISGLAGSLTGYLAGCSVVWATRIFGTLLFGKEAMGLGDVHLMGAAGAVIGPGWVILAFFVAPFFGLAWALYQFFTKKTHQIPYGPFLSLAVLVVILFQDRIYVYLAEFYGI
jgi:leader peptidase (prepilin peptidase)/N-methyltransferase